jgi:hypothetical protein
VVRASSLSEIPGPGEEVAGIVAADASRYIRLGETVVGYLEAMQRRRRPWTNLLVVSVRCRTSPRRMP